MVKAIEFLLLGITFCFTQGRLIKGEKDRFVEKDEDLALEIVRTYGAGNSYGPVSILGVNGTSGLVNVTVDGSSMFYWFTEKLNGNVTTDSVPILLWINGGPGSSSISNGALFEFGPIYIDVNSTPQLRNVTWATDYHLLFVDNPVGAGYSFAVNNSDYVNNEDQVAANFYTLLITLYQRYPAWLQHDLYFFGESYAGKYIPAITTKILLANKQKPVVTIPLRGIGIGDGWTDPIIQNAKYADYAFSAGLIDELEYNHVDSLQDKVVSLILNKDFRLAETVSNQIIDYIVKQSGGINYYNVRIYGDYYTPYIDNWLDLNSTKELFNIPTTIEFASESGEVYDHLVYDIQDSIKYQFPNILSQLKVLLYNAQDDLIVCTPGAEAWISSIPWKGQVGFNSASRIPWTVDGEVVGYATTYSNLTTVVVNKAGHLSPMDQTANTLDMVNRFVYNQTWN